MTAETVRMEIAVSDANGVYCPSVFLERFEDVLVCADTKDEICTNDRITNAFAFVVDSDNLQKDGYWDEWDFIMNRVKVRSETTSEYWTIYQNGDVRLINDADYAQLEDDEKEEFWNNLSC
jgi:hypothetical protein